MNGPIELLCVECHTSISRSLKYNYGSVGSHDEHHGVCPVSLGCALWHKTRKWDRVKQDHVLTASIWINPADLLEHLKHDGCNYDWMISCSCGNPVGFLSSAYWAAPYFAPDLKTTYFWPFNQSKKKRDIEKKQKVLDDIKSKKAFDIGWSQ